MDRDVIETVKQMIKDGQVSEDVAKKYFPQLAKPDFKEIRNRLIGLFRNIKENGCINIHIREINDFLDFLEKDSELELPDSVKPKWRTWRCKEKEEIKTHKWLWLKKRGTIDRVYYVGNGLYLKIVLCFDDSYSTATSIVNHCYFEKGDEWMYLEGSECFPQIAWKPDRTLTDSLAMIIDHPDRMTDYNKERLTTLLKELQCLQKR